MSCYSNSFLLDHYVYTYEATLEAARVFRDYCDVEISNLGDATQVKITTPAEEQSISKEFLNYVLGLSAEQLIKQD